MEKKEVVGMVTFTNNTSTWSWGRRDYYKFHTSLGYRVRVCLNETKQKLINLKIKKKEKENKRNGWWVDGPPSRRIDTEVDW